MFLGSFAESLCLATSGRPMGLAGCTFGSFSKEFNHNLHGSGLDGDGYPDESLEGGSHELNDDAANYNSNYEYIDCDSLLQYDITKLINHNQRKMRP